jgi:hypothetical protein
MLSAGPKVRGSKTRDGSVVVQYVGDFALTTAITSMTDKYLLVPEDRVLPFLRSDDDEMAALDRARGAKSRADYVLGLVLKAIHRGQGK